MTCSAGMADGPQRDVDQWFQNGNLIAGSQRAYMFLDITRRYANDDPHSGKRWTALLGELPERLDYDNKFNRRVGEGQTGTPRIIEWHSITAM